MDGTIVGFVTQFPVVRGIEWIHRPGEDTINKSALFYTNPNILTESLDVACKDAEVLLINRLWFIGRMRPISSWWPVPGPDPPTETLRPICPSSRSRDDDVLKEKSVSRIL